MSRRAKTLFVLNTSAFLLLFGGCYACLHNDSTNESSTENNSIEITTSITDESVKSGFELTTFEELASDEGPYSSTEVETSPLESDTTESSSIFESSDTESTTETETSHVHSFDNGKITKAATCVNTGIKTYTCSCGATKTETIPATGEHSYVTVTIHHDAVTHTIHHDAVTHTVHHDEEGHTEAQPCCIDVDICNGCHKIIVNSNSTWYKANASKMVSWNSNVEVLSGGYGAHDCPNWGSYHSEVVQVGMINTYVVDVAAYDEVVVDVAAYDEVVTDVEAYDEQVQQCSVCGKAK